MKQNMLPAIRLTIVCMVFFMVIYSLLIFAGAQLAPGNGKGETVTINTRVVGWKSVGQKFTKDEYFCGRPSAVDYNAAGAGGSNKGPSNPDYLKQVENRIDTFLLHNPAVKREEIPAELVTASGSGLDPDISPVAAKIQVKRIAALRNLPEERVGLLVDKQTEGPLLGAFGPAKVNVLRLNIELDKLKY